jgi:hypothetical protein
MIDCKVIGNRIYYRDRLFAPPDDELRTQILYRTHSSGSAGHPGRIKTLELITRDYWWLRMSRDVEEYVKACELCIRTKVPRTAPKESSSLFRYLLAPCLTSPSTILHHSPSANAMADNISIYWSSMRHFIPVTGLFAEELADVFINRIY